MTQESTYEPGHATRVHYATDSRIRTLAQARWRMQTGGSYPEWLALGKDNPDALITEAREWVRAAVAGGVLPPPDPSPLAAALVSPGLPPRPFEALCSFCGKTSEHVAIVQGPGVAICGECIELVTIVHEEVTKQPAERRDSDTGYSRYCGLCERMEYTAMCPNQRTDGWLS